MNTRHQHLAGKSVADPPAATRAAPLFRAGGRRFRTMRRNALVFACQISVLAILLLAWELATRQSALNAFLFGSPSAVWGFLVEMWNDGSLLTDTRVTAMETLLGFVVGNVLGTLIGLALWYSRFVSQVVQPFIVALGSI